MKKTKITELVFILDKSGSMHGLEADTVGGFNSMIEKQRKKEGKCFVSTVLFDNFTEVVHDRVLLSEIKPMTEEQFCVGGCTALCDAVGGAIKHISNVHKYARKEDVPKNTVFVIATDGMENASQKYSSDRIKEMIEEKRKKYGWEFLFLGANIDAVSTAAHFGIGADRAVRYHADPKGTRMAFSVVDAAIEKKRDNGEIEENWSEKLKKDFASRAPER